MTQAEVVLRERAAYQECQAEIRTAPSPARVVPLTGPHWSPTVAAGLLATALLAAMGLMILVISAVR